MLEFFFFNVSQVQTSNNAQAIEGLWQTIQEGTIHSYKYIPPEK